MGSGDDRRSQRRYAFPSGAPVWIRLGTSWSEAVPRDMPLRDLSASGLSFLLPGEAPGLQRGRGFAGAILSVGHHRIRGDLVIRHVTPCPGSRTVCGAVFRPRSERDLRTLRAVIDWLESEALREAAPAR